MKKTMLDHIAYFLVFLGALNWGLIAIFNGFNLVTVIFHTVPALVTFIYVLIAVAALYCLIRYYYEHCK